MAKTTPTKKPQSIRLVLVRRLECGTLNEIHETDNGKYLNLGILDGRIQWEYMS